MKKIGVLFAAALLALTFCGSIYAKYIKGFVVVETTRDSVIIKDKNNDQISVQTPPEQFKVGDEVKYDPKRNKLKPAIEEYGGC